MQDSGTVKGGSSFSEAKVRDDLSPNIAALRAEGPDTASVERLYEAYPKLLNTTRATFDGALAVLRQLAERLPEDPRAVQAPEGAARLGRALWLYRTAAAFDPN
jgi:hypothetical protein